MSDIDAQQQDADSDETDDAEPAEASDAFAEAAARRHNPGRRAPRPRPVRLEPEIPNRISPLVGGLVVVAAFAALVVILGSRRKAPVSHSLLADWSASPARWMHAAGDAEHELVAAVRKYAARLHRGTRS